jgi:hypothetical protein
MTDAQCRALESIDRHPTELARYTVSGGERVMVGTNAPGGLEVRDVPASGEGRSYRVDSGLHGAAAVGALVEDYLDQARRLDACPMEPGAIAWMLCPSDTEDLLTLLLPEA